MCGNLKHAIGTGVNNRKTSLEMFSAKVSDHIRARIDRIAQPTSTNRAREGIHDLGWETVIKGFERMLELNTHKFPVSRAGVLAQTHLTHSSVSPNRIGNLGGIDGWNITQTKLLEIGKFYA